MDFLGGFRRRLSNGADLNDAALDFRGAEARHLNQTIDAGDSKDLKTPEDETRRWRKHGGSRDPGKSPYGM